MKLLFLFLDGIGLGADDPQINPFARAQTPTLRGLLNGQALIASAAPFDGERASLRALDANLGVAGLPQSATGQAVLLTGINIPQELGYHYGPKPNPEVARYLKEGSLFSQIISAGKNAALLNAYPPRYFHGVNSGHRLYSSIPLAVTNAGIPLFTSDDLMTGRALSADFTGDGWRDHLGYPDAPVHTPPEAGRQLTALSSFYDFAFLEYWNSDYAGHKQNMASAVSQLEIFDGVLQGLLETWEDAAGLILVTSDHGNMEDLSTRKHTPAPVPGLLIGSESLRREFCRELNTIADVAPAIRKLLQV